VECVEARLISHRSTHVPSSLEELTASSRVTQNTTGECFAEASRTRSTTPIGHRLQGRFIAISPSHPSHRDRLNSGGHFLSQ
jgi:hypothetical protein